MKSQPLSIYQGDDYLAMVNVTRNGNPVDLTGYTAVAQLRRDVADIDPGTPDATFTCTIVPPSVVRMALARTLTVGLTGCYEWDLEIHETATGFVTTVARGPAHVTQEVTR